MYNCPNFKITSCGPPEAAVEAKYIEFGAEFALLFVIATSSAPPSAPLQVDQVVDCGPKNAPAGYESKLSENNCANEVLHKNTDAINKVVFFMLLNELIVLAKEKYDNSMRFKRFPLYYLQETESLLLLQRVQIRPACRIPFHRRTS